jgi:hypothetical protein
MLVPVKLTPRTNRNRPQEGNQVKLRVDPDAHHSAWFFHLIGNVLRQGVSLTAMAGAGTHRPPMIRVRTL